MNINLFSFILALLSSSGNFGPFFVGRGGIFVTNAESSTDVDHQEQAITLKEVAAVKQLNDQTLFGNDDSSGKSFLDLDKSAHGNGVGGSYVTETVSSAWNEGPEPAKEAATTGTAISSRIKMDKETQIQSSNDAIDPLNAASIVTGGRKLNAILCKDDPSFRFSIRNKRGVIKDKGDCTFVARKKKRCRRKIDGKRVRDQCQLTCSVPKCTKPSLVPSIEGNYTYVNRCDNVYQATVACGTFGLEGSDPDLCIYMDYKIGNVANETEVDDAIALDNGGFFIPNSNAGKEMAEIDSNEVCVYSGTFSASSRVQGDNILPIPLATSNGCTSKNDTTNFEFVVKATILSNGDLDIGFSNDYGNSYYTDDVECPGRYIGRKEDEDQRALGERKHRELWLLPIIIICGITSVCDIVTDPIKELLCPAPGSLTEACIPACPCKSNLQCALPELFPLQNSLLRLIPLYGTLSAFGVDPGICLPVIPKNFVDSDSMKNLFDIAKKNKVGIQNRDASLDRIMAPAMAAVARELNGKAPNAFPGLGNRDGRNLQSYVIEAVAEEPQSEAPNDFSGLSSQGRNLQNYFSGFTGYYGIGLEFGFIKKEGTSIGRWMDDDVSSCRDGICSPLLNGSFVCFCCGWGLHSGFSGDLILGFQFPKVDSLGGRSWVVDADYDAGFGGGIAIGWTAEFPPVFSIEITVGGGSSVNFGSVSSCNCEQNSDAEGLVSKPSDADFKAQQNFCLF